MSESNDERSPGFSKSLTSKLIAAGVFVVAGTVGVGYYLNYCRTCDDATEIAKQETDDKLPAKQSAAQSDAEKNEKSRTTLALKPISKPEPQQSEPGKKASFSDNSFASNKSAQSNPKNKTSFAPVNNKTSGSKPNALPPSRSFAIPKVAKPQTSFAAPQSTASPSVTPSFSPLSQQKNPASKTPSTSIANRLEQIQQSTNQFGNTNASPKTMTNNTSNSLRDAGGLSSRQQNRLNQLPKNSNGFAPTTNQTTSQQSPLPPITQNRSFDASRELKPFGSAKQSTPSNVIPPAISTSTTTTPNPTNTLTQPRGIRSSPPIQNVSARSNLRSSVEPSPRHLSTRNIPGDRKLEGLQAPSVTIEKIAPREIQVNTPADFELVVKNVGRIAANNVRVFDQIPTGTELVQSVPQPQRGAQGQISWELDTLQPGQEKRIKLQLKPLNPGEIGSVAQVSFSAMASMRTKVTKPVLAIKHSTQPKILIGDSVILDIEVKNEGDGPATDVIIQEDLPDGLAFSEGFRELEYAVGTLGPGQSRQIRLELKAAKIGKYRNVLIAQANGDLQTQHAVDLEVIAPALQASGEGPTRRYLKRKATHQFAVRNNGTAPATNVELICRLPSGLRYIDANNRGKYDENSHAVYWSLAELQPGLVANVELTTVPTEPGNQDLNFEVVSDLEQKAEAVCKLNVEHLVDVFFDIDDLVDPIEIGSDTAYKLRVVNQGTKTATNVRLQVDFPPGIQPTAVEGNISNEIRGQQIVFPPITSLNPGDEIEITIRGKGMTAGDHRLAVNLMADGREVNVSKQESTRVYSDR